MREHMKYARKNTWIHTWMTNLLAVCRIHVRIELCDGQRVRVCVCACIAIAFAQRTPFNVHPSAFCYTIFFSFSHWISSDIRLYILSACASTYAIGAWSPSIWLSFFFVFLFCRSGFMWACLHQYGSTMHESDKADEWPPRSTTKTTSTANRNRITNSIHFQLTSFCRGDGDVVKSLNWKNTVFFSFTLHFHAHAVASCHLLCVHFFFFFHFRARCCCCYWCCRVLCCAPSMWLYFRYIFLYFSIQFHFEPSNNTLDIFAAAFVNFPHVQFNRMCVYVRLSDRCTISYPVSIWFSHTHTHTRIITFCVILAITKRIE